MGVHHTITLLVPIGFFLLPLPLAQHASCVVVMRRILSMDFEPSFIPSMQSLHGDLGGKAQKMESSMS